MIDADAADEEALAAIVDAAQAVCTSYEKTAASSVRFPMNPEAEKLLTRIIVALVFLSSSRWRPRPASCAPPSAPPATCTPSFAFFIPYLIAGYDVIAGALRGLARARAGRGLSS